MAEERSQATKDNVTGMANMVGSFAATPTSKDLDVLGSVSFMKLYHWLLGNYPRAHLLGKRDFLYSASYYGF